MLTHRLIVGGAQLRSPTVVGLQISKTLFLSNCLISLNYESLHIICYIMLYIYNIYVIYINNIFSIISISIIQDLINHIRSIDMSLFFVFVDKI